MNRKILIPGIVTAIAIIACSFTFRSEDPLFITGKVIPAEGVSAVWAINKTDSIKALLENGTFALTVKPGTYNVVIDAVDPYKGVTKKNITVKEKKPRDLGEIILKK